MTLFCFDVDGTLLTEKMLHDESEYVTGIVPNGTLGNLLNQGHHIAIVSPSPYFPKFLRHFVFAEYGSNEYRWKNVMDAMIDFDVTPGCTVYIDDLSANHKNVKNVFPSIKCYYPEDFMKEYGP